MLGGKAIHKTSSQNLERRAREIWLRIAQMFSKSQIVLRPLSTIRSSFTEGSNLEGRQLLSFGNRRCLIPLSAWAEVQGPRGAMTRTWQNPSGSQAANRKRYSASQRLLMGRWQKDRPQRQNLTCCQSANRMHPMAAQRQLLGWLAAVHGKPPNFGNSSEVAPRPPGVRTLAWSGN